MTSAPPASTGSGPQSPGSSIPKAVLYYSPDSVWSCVVRLTLEEKGYSADELELRVVDLSQGENFSLSFLRLNPKATVPTLVVPFKDTLSADTESRYKALTETPKIVEFLDTSRSSLSRTHTTSTLPAPTLAPATIAFLSAQKIIINEIIHAPLPPDAVSALSTSPVAGAVGAGVVTDVANAITNYNALKKEGGVEALVELARERIPILEARKRALEANLLSVSESATSPGGTPVPRASAKVKALWTGHVEVIKELLDVFQDAANGKDGEGVERKREVYWERARVLWEGVLRERVVKLNKAVGGPFAFGDQLSLADLHIAGFLARLVKLSGGSIADDGVTALSRVERRIGVVLPKDYNSAAGGTVGSPGGDEAVTPTATSGSGGAAGAAGTGGKTSKLAAFWDAMRERGSWKGVFGDGLR